MPGRKYVSSATDDEYGYSGDYSRKNDATNWNEFQYRNYDSRIGRWLSPDPMRQYSSPYVGMGNNQISTVDPTGLWGYSDGNGNYLYVKNFYANSFKDASGTTWTKVAENLDEMVKKAGGINNFAHARLEGFRGGYMSIDVYHNPSGGISDQKARDLQALSRVDYRSSFTRLMDDIHNSIPIASSAGRGDEAVRRGDYLEAAGEYTMSIFELLTFGEASMGKQTVQTGGEALAKELTEEGVEQGAKLLGRHVNASWGAFFKYRHGGWMSAIEHITYRHGANSGFANVSKFTAETSVKAIKGYVDDALRYGAQTADGGYLYNVGKTIGTNLDGTATSYIKVYARDGWVKTAFPF